MRDEVSTARGTQKVSALMLPQGGKLTTLGELSAGRTAAVTGLDVRPGERIGAELTEDRAELVPLMSVRVEPVPPLELTALLAHLRELEEEDPLLAVTPEAEADVQATAAEFGITLTAIGELVTARGGRPMIEIR